MHHGQVFQRWDLCDHREIARVCNRHGLSAWHAPRTTPQTYAFPKLTARGAWLSSWSDAVAAAGGCFCLGAAGNAAEVCFPTTPRTRAFPNVAVPNFPIPNGQSRRNAGARVNRDGLRGALDGPVPGRALGVLAPKPGGGMYGGALLETRRPPFGDADGDGTWGCAPRAATFRAGAGKVFVPCEHAAIRADQVTVAIAVFVAAASIGLPV